MIQMHGVVSECERDQISSRTRAALAAAKSRGVVLGATGPANLSRRLEKRVAGAVAFSAQVREFLRSLRATGHSQRAIVGLLNEMHVTAPRGGAWSLVQLQRVLCRLQPRVGEMQARTVDTAAGHAAVVDAPV